MDKFAHLYEGIDPLRTSRRSVDASKVTDHHALLITGDYVRETLTANEQRVYDMICGRMLESFGPRCEKDTLLVEATIDGLPFRSRSTAVVSAGWRAVYNRPEEPGEGEDDDDIGAAGMEFVEGETLSVMGHSLARRKTRPKPLYTEATLLSAMETAGRQITDEKAREAMMQSGLGTPATRAGIIETLLCREYIERSGKLLIPTERGIALYKAVKDLRIADPQLTGDWEKSLAMIETGEMKPETFMKAIAIYTRQITAEVLSLDLKQSQGEVIPCPKCGNGRIIIRHKLAKCDGDKCGLVVWRRFLNRDISEANIKLLLKSGKTRLITGFEGKAGKTFDACLTFDKNYNLTFKFPEAAKKKAATGGRGKSKPKAGTKTGTKIGTASRSAPIAGAEPETKPKSKPKATAKSGLAPKNKTDSGNAAAK
jgi:DNA topoisomerase-3